MKTVSMPMVVSGLNTQEVKRFRYLLHIVRGGRLSGDDWAEFRALLQKVDQETIDDFGIPRWVKYPYALRVVGGFPAALNWPTWSWKDKCLLFGWVRMTENIDVIWMRLISLKLRRPGFGFHSAIYFSHLADLDKWLKEGGEA